MKVYLVKFKKNKPTQYRGYSITQTEEKYFFHQKPDQSDYDTFVLASEVLGVDCLGDAPPESPRSFYVG